MDREDVINRPFDPSDIAGFVAGAKAHIEPKPFVVDVFIPIAIEVNALDVEMAESMAEDMLNESPVRARINAVVDEDVDTAFVMSDSPARFEAGEA